MFLCHAPTNQSHRYSHWLHPSVCVMTVSKTQQLTGKGKGDQQVPEETQNICLSHKHDTHDHTQTHVDINSDCPSFNTGRGGFNVLCFQVIMHCWLHWKWWQQLMDTSTTACASAVRVVQGCATTSWGIRKDHSRVDVWRKRSTKKKLRGVK